jgi:hypothetical protein
MDLKIRWSSANCAWSVHGLMWHELDMLEAHCQTQRAALHIAGTRPLPKQDNDVLSGVAAPYVGVTGPLCRTRHVRELVLEAIQQLLKTLGDAKRLEMYTRW